MGKSSPPSTNTASDSYPRTPASPNSRSPTSPTKPTKTPRKTSKPMSRTISITASAKPSDDDGDNSQRLHTLVCLVVAGMCTVVAVPFTILGGGALHVSISSYDVIGDGHSGGDGMVRYMAKRDTISEAELAACLKKVKGQTRSDDGSKTGSAGSGEKRSNDPPSGQKTEANRRASYKNLRLPRRVISNSKTDRNQKNPSSTDSGSPKIESGTNPKPDYASKDTDSGYDFWNWLALGDCVIVLPAAKADFATRRFTDMEIRLKLEQFPLRNVVFSAELLVILLSGILCCCIHTQHTCRTKSIAILTVLAACLAFMVEAGFASGLGLSAWETGSSPARTGTKMDSNPGPPAEDRYQVYVWSTMWLLSGLFLLFSAIIFGAGTMLMFCTQPFIDEENYYQLPLVFGPRKNLRRISVTTNRPKRISRSPGSNGGQVAQGQGSPGKGQGSVEPRGQTQASKVRPIEPPEGQEEQQHASVSLKTRSKTPTPPSPTPARREEDLESETKSFDELFYPKNDVPQEDLQSRDDRR